MAQLDAISWVSEHPDKTTKTNSDIHDAPVFRPRKPHTKSRNACSGCKQRRIKCDEAKPECGQCVHRGVQCVLITPNSNKARLPSPPTMLPSQISESELLDHFTQTIGEWIGSPECQKTLQEQCHDLIVGAPYLKHAILAFAASHIAFLVPSQKLYKAASNYHYERSLILYASQLANNLNAENRDQIIGCGHLQTMLAFQNVTTSERNLDDNKLSWLRAMRAIPILWRSNNLHDQLVDSIWLSVCLESHAIPRVESCNHVESGEEKSWALRTCRDLHIFCEAEGDLDLYEGSLAHLCVLMQTEVGPEHIGWFVMFLGECSDLFLEKLQDGEPAALLLLTYWCALFVQIDQWWIVQSAIVECRKLCGMLEALCNDEVNKLLLFPASKCGYVLQSQVKA